MEHQARDTAGSRPPRLRIGEGSLSRLRGDIRTIGFAAIADALPEADLRVLAAEARGAVSEPGAATSSGTEDGVAYSARLGDLGPAGRAFLGSAPVLAALDRLFAAKLAMTPEASCYTAYGPGGFLGIHRDHAELCAATLILYLDARSPDPRDPATGLRLCVYAGEGRGSLRLRGAIPTLRGTLVFGRGSEIWHERPPLRAGEDLTALTACFSRSG